MFLWQVEFWLAKNLLFKLQRSRAVYFKINNRSLWPFSKDTRIYVFPIIRTYLLMLEHSDKNVISLEMLYSISRLIAYNMFSILQE
jgi:hypothetical protein